MRVQNITNQNAALSHKSCQSCRLVLDGLFIKIRGIFSCKKGDNVRWVKALEYVLATRQVETGCDYAVV